MTKKITKAVFPVAGMGTRFLPATKASPKEMLPVVDKPLIQYAVEEAVAAGITEMIFVTGRNKRSIEDHFDKAYELETELEIRNKQKLLSLVQEILPPHVSCLYIRQTEALGLGHAVLCARPAVGDEPFAVILADDLIDGEPGAMEQMVKLYEASGASVLGVENVAREETGSYGIVEVAPVAEGRQQVSSIVEKPHPDVAPSTLAVVGRYILTPRIFDKLRETRPGAGGEIQLTDGIAALLKEEPVLALPFEGTRYDCGSKLGYLKATIAYGCKHPEVGVEFAHYLKTLDC
ncbi:UTP--glucose-1-phosphate uridylyltransferase GalU [Crenobacter sp. SG2305]|uniref:UTP--glucose-1-phosphate uridylyltransferase GalU n=1 Tax=Crenobacter oryzisoli TaxID=3056844 RepID=UPI0025AB1637|nr:UTP--glucose-1-phosphate uridylyltransferase GalU [Crenobacter sp. SG2305]MDN0082661.1 UTP--glucose-1-phosphate uridylyltransferase GalU [Crenobacter sp. SG2305]